MSKEVLLLVGSPKPSRSTSEVLGDYVLAGLQRKGLRTEKLNIRRLLITENGSEELTRAVDACDILIFSSPLYVDGTPAMVVKAMEIMAESRQGKAQHRKQTMLAISNCGFPEAHQNHTALAIYKCFAKEAGFEWGGGLALGGGGAIDGKGLASFGGMVRNIVKSLDLTVETLPNQTFLPEEAIKLMEKPLFPNWLYLLAGDYGWRSQAKKHGASKKLKDRPYQK